MIASGLRVAVAEDEALSLKRLVRLLQEAGCTVIATFPEGRGMLDWLQAEHSIDALFLDIHMPNLDGMEILKFVQGRIPVVLTTAFSEHAVEAYDAEAVDYLLKPITASRLDRSLRRILARRKAPGIPRHPTGDVGGHAVLPNSEPKRHDLQIILPRVLNQTVEERKIEFAFRRFY